MKVSGVLESKILCKKKIRPLVSRNTCPTKAVNRQALEISVSLPPGSTPKSAHAVSGKPEPAAK